MKIRDYYDLLDSAGRKAFAERLGTSEAYTWQLANGHRLAGAKYLARIYEATHGQVTMQELRPDLFRQRD